MFNTNQTTRQKSFDYSKWSWSSKPVVPAQNAPQSDAPDAKQSVSGHDYLLNNDLSSFPADKFTFLTTTIFFLTDKNIGDLKTSKMSEYNKMMQINIIAVAAQVDILEKMRQDGNVECNHTVSKLETEANKEEKEIGSQQSNRSIKTFIFFPDSSSCERKVTPHAESETTTTTTISDSDDPFCFLSRNMWMINVMVILFLLFLLFLLCRHFHSYFVILLYIYFFFLVQRLLDKSQTIQIFNGEFYFGILRKYVVFQQRMIYWRYRLRDIFMEINKRIYTQWPAFRDLVTVNLLQNHHRSSSSSFSSSIPSNELENNNDPVESGVSYPSIPPLEQMIRNVSESNSNTNSNFNPNKMHGYRQMVDMVVLCRALYLCIQNRDGVVYFTHKPNSKQMSQGKLAFVDKLLISWEIMVSTNKPKFQKKRQNACCAHT